MRDGERARPDAPNLAEDGGRSSQQRVPCLRALWCPVFHCIVFSRSSGPSETRPEPPSITSITIRRWLRSAPPSQPPCDRQARRRHTPPPAPATSATSWLL